VLQFTIVAVLTQLLAAEVPADCLMQWRCIALLQIYREKIKAAVEGRPFTPPPPSAVQVTVGSSSSARPGSAGAGSFSNGSRQAAGNHDEWGDWGDKPAAPNGATAGASGFSSNSEYSRAQYMASAANKDEFFSRKMQENQSKPDHLPPSQGGKYVGFGSAPAPRPQGGMRPGAGGVDDVTALFSKGLASLGQVAGVAATTATTVVQSGTQNINQLLQEKQVGQTLQQTSQVVAEKAQVRGVWVG
jgi:ADP-ribosylation factor GTPase-activating protein 1